MRISASLLAVIFLLGLETAATAAGSSDPDWPCIQRRQPQLSLGQVWAGPPADEAVLALTSQGPIQELAKIIALRRTSLPEAESMIAEFAQTANASELTALFVASFTEIQTARDHVMRGITRYAHRQAELDAEINQKRQNFTAESAKDSPDFDTLDRLEGEIEWSTRIFQDRQQSLTYVCETPVILEQRAFALGRAVLSHMAK